MNFLLMFKKTSKIYIWLAVDRNRNEVVDIEVSKERDFGAYLQLALRLEKKYKKMVMMLIRNIELLIST